MDRFAVYRDISPTYVLCDRRTDSVVALFVNLGDAERTARRLNDRPPRPASLRALARRVTDPTTRYVVQSAFHDFERIVVDQWTGKIVWDRSSTCAPPSAWPRTGIKARPTTRVSAHEVRPL